MPDVIAVDFETTLVPVLAHPKANLVAAQHNDLNIANLGPGGLEEGER